MNIIPRSKFIWALGGRSYSGNPRFLLNYILQNHKEITAFWLTRNKKLAKQLRAQGLPSYYDRSILGVFYAIRAKYYFYTHICANELSKKYSSGAVAVNLWHGIGIKTIEGTMGRRPKNNDQGSYYMLSTTAQMNKKYCESFLISETQCMPFGTPRNDHFFKDKSTQRSYLKKNSKKEYDLIRLLEKYTKVFIYLPTFRDSINEKAVDQSMDYAMTNQYLEKNNQILLLKPHLSSQYEKSLHAKFSHIRYIPEGCDLNLILPFTDVLITDYSSVYFDYILLNKPIILYPYDYHHYTQECRALYFDYYESTVGPYAYTFSALFKLIQQDLIAPDYSKIRETFWGNYRGKSCHDITDFIKKLDAE